MFSKKGAKLDSEKIQQIQKTPVPENKKNLTKFSETGQLHENILHDYITQISHLQELPKGDTQHYHLCELLKAGKVYI